MNNLLKHAAFVGALLISLSSCKKEKQSPVITEFQTSEQTIALGQYMTITPIVTDGDTDPGGLSYNWTSTEGFKSSESVAKWTPSKSGKQTLTLTVSDGAKSSSKAIEIVVSEADFRLALWGNSNAKIQLFESKAGKTPLSSNLTTLVYQASNSTTADAYILTNEVVTRGVTAFSKTYTSNYNQYVTDYNATLNTLKSKYGNFVSSKIFYKTTEIQTQLTGHPELVGDAIVTGDAVLQAIWNYGKNTIRLELFKSSTSTNIIMGIYYAPTTNTVTATTSSLPSFADTKVRTEIEAVYNLAF